MFCRPRNLEERKKRKLKFYNIWEDALEVRLAGIKAAKAKLEEQINDQDTDTREPFSPENPD